jgi:hypothetical protein
MLRRDSSLRIHKVAAATLMSVMAAGSIVAATSGPAAARTSPNLKIITGGVTVKPAATNLLNNHKVTVNIKGFTGSTTLYVAECAAQVIGKRSLTYCDQTNLVTLTGVVGGKATTPFTIHAGAGFKPGTTAAKCQYKQNCLILVADSMTVADINNVGFQTITFKGVGTKTKVTSKKKITAGKTLVFKATTTHSKGTGLPTGAVTFLANGKKFAKVAEKKTGKVTVKHKFKKAGTYHILVEYAGNNVYVPSVGKETIVVKKK